MEEGPGKAGAKSGGPPGGASSPGSLLPRATLVPTRCPHGPLPAGLWPPPFPSSGWPLCIIVQALPAVPPQVTTRFLRGLTKLGTPGTLLLPPLRSPVSRSWAMPPLQPQSLQATAAMSSHYYDSSRPCQVSDGQQEPVEGRSQCGSPAPCLLFSLVPPLFTTPDVWVHTGPGNLDLEGSRSRAQFQLLDVSAPFIRLERSLSSLS